MPTYVVLGATGNIGLNVLRELGRQQSTNSGGDIHINAYARSKPKLLSSYPEAASNKQLSIHAGSLSDLDLLTTCIKDADVIFQTVATSYNIPDCQIAQNTARLLVEALERRRSNNKNDYRPPLLIILSSASVSEKLLGEPPFWHSTLLKAASYVYSDLVIAENFLRTYDGNANRGLYDVTFVKPAGMIHDASKGHVLSTEESKTFTSFADCGAGMVEIGRSRDEREWDGVEVSVNSAAPGGADVSLAQKLELAKFVLWGLLCHFLPWIYRWV